MPFAAIAVAPITQVPPPPPQCWSVKRTETLQLCTPQQTLLSFCCYCCVAPRMHAPQTPVLPVKGREICHRRFSMCADRRVNPQVMFAAIKPQPSLQDKFYLNLLDLSSHDVLLVGLRHAASS